MFRWLFFHNVINRIKYNESLKKEWTNMKRIIYLICFIGILYFLTETNPSRSQYVEWLNEEALNDSTNFLEKGVISLVGQTFFDASTSVKNYYIFSIFTTDLSDTGKGKMKAIGVFNQIIPLK
jgi:hypothetical protein